MIYANPNYINVLNEANVPVINNIAFNYLPDRSRHCLRLKVYIGNKDVGEVMITEDRNSEYNFTITNDGIRPEEKDAVRVCRILGIGLYPELREYIDSKRPDFRSRMKPLVELLVKKSKLKEGKHNRLKRACLERYMEFYNEMPVNLNYDY